MHCCYRDCCIRGTRNRSHLFLRDSPKWGRKELPRVYLPKAQIPGYMYIFSLYRNNRKYVSLREFMAHQTPRALPLPIVWSLANMLFILCRSYRRAFLCLTFCLLAHGTTVKWGLRLQNALGMFKIIILLMIAACGILCLAGAPGFSVREEYDPPKNFEWRYFWEGSGTGTNAFVTGLYNVIWSVCSFSYIDVINTLKVICWIR
ncbi:hypothetical protein BD779DRAFT_1546812 [Infundibulicybe gibba]|nr:hypothetical protein BD779DRAFT_1546812 [Infundibulicybe gibba]